MKKIAILLLLFPFLLINCEKDSLFSELVRVFLPGPKTHGEATAIKNGTDFEASAYAVEEDWSEGTFSLLFYTYTEEGYHREILGFNEIPHRKGNYILGNASSYNDGIAGASYGTLADDGDVGEDHYDLMEEMEDNYIEVTHIDTVAREVEGTFTASFYITSPSRMISNPVRKRNPENPDHIKFSDGWFKVKFID